jgi:hypothetical protein
MKILADFIFKLFQQWIVYLGLIPSLYDLINAYFKLEFEFPQYILIAFPIVIFIYASFEIYRGEYLKRLSLEKKLEGPTNYEITAIINPINFEKDKLLAQVDNLKKQVIEKLQSVPVQIALNQTDGLAGLLHTSPDYISKANLYNEALKEYETKLKNIEDNIDSVKSQISNRVDELNNQFFFINFSICNMGMISDTEIQVNIESFNNNIVFEKMKIFDHGMDLYHLMPSLPKVPELSMFKPSFNTANAVLMSNLQTPILPNMQSPLAFRKWEKINENQCSVTIRDLHVGDETDLFIKDLILLQRDEQILFRVTIKSKEATRVLTPAVIVRKENKSKRLFEKES